MNNVSKYMIGLAAIAAVSVSARAAEPSYDELKQEVDQLKTRLDQIENKQAETVTAHEVDATVEGTGEDPWGNQRVGIAVRGEIDRTEFGLRWQQKLTTGGLLIGENVKVLADISAVRA